MEKEVVNNKGDGYFDQIKFSFVFWSLPFDKTIELMSLLINKKYIYSIFNLKNSRKFKIVFEIEDVEFNVDNIIEIIKFLDLTKNEFGYLIELASDFYMGGVSLPEWFIKYLNLTGGKLMYKYYLKSTLLKFRSNERKQYLKENEVNYSILIRKLNETTCDSMKLDFDQLKLTYFSGKVNQTGLFIIVFHWKSEELPPTDFQKIAQKYSLKATNFDFWVEVTTGKRRAEMTVPQWYIDFHNEIGGELAFSYVIC